MQTLITRHQNLSPTLHGRVATNYCIVRRVVALLCCKYTVYKGHLHSFNGGDSEENFFNVCVNRFVKVIICA